jgi:hypothetical protein
MPSRITLIRDQTGLQLGAEYTPLAVVSHTCKTLRISTTATVSANFDVSSKEGAVIVAVLSKRKFHRGRI